MTNRVIKDSIWTSPTLADLSDFVQDQFPRWLLMADDWGCFNTDSRVIKGTAYPLRGSMTIKKIDAVKREMNEAGLLFLWSDGMREWGYFVSWESHHNYCNKTNVDNDGKQQKNRRKTPEPPEDLLSKYLEEVKNKSGHISTQPDKILSYSSSLSSSLSRKNAPKGAPTSPDEFAKELAPHYPHVNVDAELRKMKAWHLAHPGKWPNGITRRAMVRWLNRIEVPLRGAVSKPAPSQAPPPLPPREEITEEQRLNNLKMAKELTKRLFGDNKPDQSRAAG